MRAVLLHLAGPMQSWADTGFGLIREAGPAPSRSAVLGIAGAAMGYVRGDARLVVLHDAFRVHVATAQPGEVRRDYHTVETRPGSPKTLTWRDYHHDAHWVAVVVPAEAPPPGSPSLADVAAALRTPVYGTFLGRRSCPPSVPLWPQEVDGDPFEALVAAARASAGALPVTGEAREPRWEAVVEASLDGLFAHPDGHPLPSAFASADGLRHDVRRDHLVAPRRAYVNRPDTRLRLRAHRADPHADAFDAF